MCLCFFVDSERSWDLERLNLLLSPQVVEDIINFKPPIGSMDHDFMQWRRTVDGSFSKKSAFESLIDQSIQVHEPS